MDNIDTEFTRGYTAFLHTFFFFKAWQLDMQGLLQLYNCLDKASRVLFTRHMWNILWDAVLMVGLRHIFCSVVTAQSQYSTQQIINDTEFRYVNRDGIPAMSTTVTVQVPRV